MNLTYTPEQCQAARALEDEIVRLEEETEKLKFLIDTVDYEVFEPARVRDVNPTVTSCDVKRNAPGMLLALDCLNRINGALERMNQGICMSISQQSQTSKRLDV